MLDWEVSMEEISCSFIYGLIYHKHRITMFTRTQKETHILLSRLANAFTLFHHGTSIDANASKAGAGTCLSLLNAVGLCRLSIHHLCVLLLGRRRRIRLCLGLCFPLGTLELSLLGCHLLLILLLDSLSLALNFVVVALDDGAGNGADILLLGNILCFCGVLTVIV
jgi:hypothetical protein